MLSNVSELRQSVLLWHRNVYRRQQRLAMGKWLLWRRLATDSKTTTAVAAVAAEIAGTDAAEAKKARAVLRLPAYIAL